MNYIPLYRKYRPQTLEEIVGQEHIKNALKNAIELNKVSHAYLFTGPRGTGKTSTARIFAKSLNCEKGPTVEPCGICENCKEITNSTPVDVIEIDAASNRKVEDAQNILEKIMYAPVKSRYKIYIIDEVHMLSTTAFNALLKTLEEPPKNVVFILATTEIHKVLDTIKSRCQRFDFKRITTEDITKHLRYIAQKEGINITDDALLTVAKNSAGGMRDSIALLDQLSVLNSQNAITTDDINNLLGRISFDTLISLTEKIVNSKFDEAVEFIENVYNSGNEPVLILNNLLGFIKNMLIVKTCSDEISTEITQVNNIQLDALKNIVKNLETQQIVSLVNKCTEYIKEVKQTNNQRLWLEIAVIDMTNIAQNTKIADLEYRISILESNNNINVETKHKQKSNWDNAIKITNKDNEHTTNIEKNNKQTETDKSNLVSEEDFSPIPNSKKQTGTPISDLWAKLLQEIQSAPVRALLKQWANPLIISPKETVIVMKSEIFLKQVQAGSKYDSITGAIDKLFSQNNSKVIIRLAQADDIKIEQPQVQVNINKKINKPAVEPDNTLDISDLEEFQNNNTTQQITDNKTDVIASSMYSDNVNMVVKLFDGKVID